MARGTASLQRVFAPSTESLAGAWNNFTNIETSLWQLCVEMKERFTDANLQDEYERETGSGTGGRGSEDLLSQVEESSVEKSQASSSSASPSQISSSL